MGDKIYWSRRDKIQRANLDGTNVQDVVTGLDEPEDIAIDVSGGKIYWTEEHDPRIQRANLDGTNVQDAVTGLNRPYGIALDVSRGKIYWTEEHDPRIQRANLDGTNIQDVVTGLDEPEDIAIDVSGGKIYWTESSEDRIQRANLDGSDVHVIVAGLDGPRGIALDIARGEIYWTDYHQDGIWRANLDGSDVHLVAIGVSSPTAIALGSYHAGIQEEQSVTAEGDRKPMSLEIISGGNQEGLPGAALANPFVVEVRDQTDKPLPGVEVTFSVSNGGGTLNTINATTKNNGQAESTLTLGPNPGKNTATASAAGIEEVQTFSAEGIRIPNTLEIISGGDQQGLPGEALAKPFVVEVRDQSGEPLLGVQVTFSVSSGGGTLSVTSTTTDSDGRAESTLTLGPNPGPNTVTVSVTGIQEEQTVTAIAEPPPIPQDVNRDDVVNILDLVFVASALGDEGTDLAADVNGDGVVNILDLVLVAGAFGNVLAAPSSDSQALSMMTAADVRQWLVQAGEFGLVDTTAQRGVLFLEQLLAALAPKETALLPNYPNPFNPETWIPYQLARDADVTLTIHALNGQPVRHLTLGHQVAGTYYSRSRAAYWDGKNDFGEPAASGIYFYTLTAGDFTATRKMLIRK